MKFYGFEKISKTLWRDLLTVSISRIVIVLFQLIYLKVYTTQLSTHDLGIYALWCTISYVLSASVFVPIDYYQQSKIYPLRSQGHSLKGLVYFNFKILKWVGIIAVAVVIVVAIFEKILALYITIAVALAVTMYVTIALRGLLNNLEYKHLVSSVQVFEAIIRVALFICLIYLTGKTAVELISSQVIAFIFTSIILIWFCMRKGIFDQGRMIIVNNQEVIKFCLPITIGAILNLVQLQGYRLILAPLGYVEIIGVYFGTTQVGIALMSFFSLIFVQIFTPNIYKTNGEYIKIYLRNALLLIAGVFFIGLIFSHPLVTLATKPEFANKSLLILYGIVAEGGNLLIGGLTIYLIIRGKNKQMLLASFYSTIASLFSIIILHFCELVNIYTIGLPIVISQVSVIIYMFRVYINEVNFK
jgi:O-antigen/teichoic acid export membrane protein